MQKAVFDNIIICYRCQTTLSAANLVHRTILGVYLEFWCLKNNQLVFLKRLNSLPADILIACSKKFA